MARFDVHVLAHGSHVLDVQADLLQGLNTRVVVPLMAPDDAPQPARHLNPTLRLGDQAMVMVTQFMAAVPLAELGAPIASLAGERDAILAAVDFLHQGW